MPDDVIKSKRDYCAERLRESYPKIFENSKVDEFYLNLNSLNFSKIPSIGEEFLVWDDMFRKYYWRSFQHIMKLEKADDKNPLSEEDKKTLTEEMMNQIKIGEHVAVGVPLYSDVWCLAGKEGSPLEKYVTEEQKKFTVNVGFWETLKKTSDSSIKKYSCNELSRIIEYEDFFKYFDFKDGAKKTNELPASINLEEFDNWDLYTRWYLVQEIELFRVLKKEQVDDARGKLIAPLIHYLLTTPCYREEDEQLKKFANFFIKGDVVKTEPMQHVFGGVFERELESAFEPHDSEYRFSLDKLRLCERNLTDVEKHAAAVWERAKGRVDVSMVPNEVKGYIPQEKYESHLQSMKKNINEMERFDVKVFREWVNLDLKKYNISKSAQGKIRNKALELYFSQKVRPSGDHLVSMLDYAPAGSNYTPDKTRGFLFSDLLLRKRWKNANEILMHYDSLTYAYLGRFYQAVHDYVKIHGPIKLDESGLETNACYPKYNNVVNFNKRFPKLFKLKK